jgi:DNA-directed RNA polymerase subunit RPC12/RpoP
MVIVISKGFRVIIDDTFRLPKCFECGKQFKTGDYAIIYLKVQKPKVRCIRCHNSIMIKIHDSSGEKEKNYNW